MKKSFLINTLVFFVMFYVTTSFALSSKPPAIVSDIEKRLLNLPKTEIDYDKSLLTENDERVVAKLIEATTLIDNIFLLQVDSNNLELRKSLADAAKTSKSYQKALEMFDLMKGRWDRISQNEPFIAPFGKKGQKPEGAGFYPVDMTKQEFKDWLVAHPNDQKEFESLTTVITRQNHILKSVPYSQYYAAYLQPAAQKLREAAAITSNQSLKKFLNSRADALLSDDYFQSDIDWMDLDSNLEVVIGPYEVYEDALFSYKSSYEAFLMAIDKKETEKLKVYAAHLKDMELNLPIPDQYKNVDRSFASPIRVEQEIFAGGDGRHAVILSAFTLPNDEKVREVKGSKKVLVKNVMAAKFAKSGEPIARKILDRTQTISFDAYFNDILFHELSHGLGPSFVVGPDGKKQEPRMYLKDLYTPIEECKADVVGVWNLLYALDHHLISSFDKNTLYSTYVGLMFRLMRHGINEAHGRGSAVQWNWMREKGAIIETQNGLFKPVHEKMDEGIRSLANELLMIEATGDYQRAKTLLERYGKSTKEIEQISQRLKDIPVDINPVFVGVGEKI